MKRQGFLIKLTQEEKELLIEKQKKSGYGSLAEYIRHMCFQEKDNTLDSIIGNGSSDKLLDGSVQRERQISFKVSEEEYETIKKYAGNMRLSAYIRKVLLTSQLGKYNFEINTHDLNDISKELSEFNMRLAGIIGALQFRTELYKEDAVRIRKQVEEVNESIKEIRSRVMTDRKYVRKKGVEVLTEQIKKVFKGE